MRILPNGTPTTIPMSAPMASPESIVLSNGPRPLPPPLEKVDVAVGALAGDVTVGSGTLNP
jgi:hypothetical protein